MHIALAQLNTTVGDLDGNTQKILHAIDEARKAKADLVLFPELTITGYPADDFLLLPHFLQAVEEKLAEIVAASKGIAVVVGLPRRHLNSAAVIDNGALLGFQDKSLLPTYDVFDERRYFEPALESRIWIIKGKRVAVTICEDIWKHAGLAHYTHDPILDLKEQRPDVLLNLSASPYNPTQEKKRIRVCQSVAATLNCPVYFCNQVGGNDSLVFDGRSLIVDAKGALLAQGKAFEEDLILEPRLASPMKPIQELHAALVLGVRDYFQKLGFKKAVLGLSGGIDSAVVAAIAVKALGPSNVLALFMPSRFTSDESRRDAKELAAKLSIPLEELSIEGPFAAFLHLLEPAFKGHAPDVTEENMQARIRSILLMAFSNKFGHILLSTGNKSELAMGYCTLYGDLTGGLAILSDVTKKQVYELAHFIGLIPENIIQRAPSAELRPNQKDSDSLPEYDVVDAVVKLYVEEHLSPAEIAKKTGYDGKLVEDLIKRIHQNEYKRRQGPPGLRVSEKAFTAGRRFPIVQRWT